ncbi:MAG TPA: D-aminoacylase [Candidatus Sumerlaeia bacterium]|nr:D-aminoacylase [Candidatus Sumerlaeia bacterium]
MFDIILKGGEIIDGSGKPAFRADIALAGDKIAEIGDLKNESALKIIDASALAIAPGFIDAHSHGDLGILINPQAESKIRQGITTMVAGNCGSSPFPLRGKALEETRDDMAKYDITVDWDSAAGYYARVEAAQPAVNFSSLVGQGAIRASVMGELDIPADASFMDDMKNEVALAMDAGSIGISTGLIYTPGSFATEDEIAELAKVAASKGGIYSSHIRGEGDSVIQAIKEALAIGFKSGCPVQISHLKASAPRNWGKVKDAIALIEKAESDGLNVWFDKYPYTAGSTGLNTYLPRWSVGQGVDKLMEFLQDPVKRSQIFKEANDENEGEKKWESVIIISAESDKYRPYEGKNIFEIAQLTNQTIEDTFCDLLFQSRARADIVCFTQSQDDTDLALEHRLGLVCTDSGIWAPYGPLSAIKPHPRAYGTFPRFFRQYVKEKKSLTREEAVKKATHLAAERLGFSKRGQIKKDYFADIVLIDWERINDTATYTEPHRYPEGIEGVIVNGALTIWRGEPTGLRAGRVLKRNS